MANKENNSTYQYPSTLDELIDYMEKHPVRYKQLQFILNRKKHHRLGMGQRYLVVNRFGFGLYELISVDYSNGIIQMIFTNPDTGNPAEFNLEANYEQPDIYLINWKDVEEMVYAGVSIGCDNDELLELEDE